jgi:2-(3-amino-3-carboxypropyl)histidine synthase
MDYEIDYEKIRQELKKGNAKRVLIQLPDGLKKDYARIEKNLKGDYELFFWLGSCFGACDIPSYVKDFGFDFIVHFGHTEFIKGK